MKIDLRIDLVDKYRDNHSLKNSCVEFFNKNELRSSNFGYHKGDIIKVIGGNDSNILYNVEIFGFDNDSIYLVWDCYWFPKKLSSVVTNGN